MIFHASLLLKLNNRYRCSIAAIPIIVVGFCFNAEAQVEDSDSLKATLQEVQISAYEQNRSQLTTATPLGLISSDAILMQQPQSALQAINAIPGVRMEERSPGSYRLNVRGSAMRAPFGVRNVKVYYNGIPFTEPGGTTYINQMGLLNFRDAEIVKGPGSSMYGAGTGGVVLLQHKHQYNNNATLGYATGSFGMHSFFANVNLGNANSSQHIAYQQNISRGYREQSRMNRATFNWDAEYKLNKRQQLQTTIIYGDLYYQTPGALTFTEYEANRKSARPSAGNFPSAQNAKAAIEQQTIVSGITLLSRFAGNFTNKTTAYAAFTTLENAAIRNYSYNSQPHAGVRSLFQYEKQSGGISFKVLAGGELQAAVSDIEVYDNSAGAPGAIQRHEVVNTTVAYGFAQAQVSYKNWELLIGSSLNTSKLNYSQSFPLNALSLERSNSGILAPRLSLSKLLHKNLFVYGLIAKGFSPPTTDELLPSGSAFNENLQPELGLNYELGVRYELQNKVFLELNGYYFRLDNTIVQRRDAGGGDYYLNAGYTQQPGIEFSGRYTLGDKDKVQSVFRLSYAYQPYTYGSFAREDDDYSGNALPGLSVHNVFSAIQIRFLSYWTASVNYFYNSKLPLNDANSNYASDNHIVNCKFGREISSGKYRFCLYAGIDNALNEKYSLGFDINAAGSRYYNAAPERNYYCQLVITR